MEEWRDIEGFEGLYQVSNTGKVKSLNYRRTGKEKILKAYPNGHDYLQVKLHKDGKKKSCRVNRLVAQAFIPNPDNLPEVNHKDEDKTNNCVENLEWCSKLYNINYGTGRKRSAEKLRGRKHSEEHNKKVAEKLRGRKQTEEHIKKRSKPVIGINKISGLIIEFPSLMEAERCTGISNGNICTCLKGKRKLAGGFYWHYADSEEVDHEQE